MRTSLFLSTLFAVSMPLATTAGTALAERPHDTPAREPRAVEQLRSHGDMVDKSYSALADRADRNDARASQASPSRQPRQASQARYNPSASRINCSDTGADCGSAGSAASAHAAAHAGGSHEASHAQTSRSARVPAFLDKVLGSDRTNFNEAGEDQGMSSRSANRAWARSAAEHHGASPTPLAAPVMVDRVEQQASTVRMSCNEGDECSMSTKGARKEWAKASIKAGTWSGPAPDPVSNAALRLAAQRAAADATPKGSQGKDGHAAEGHAPEAEHDH